MRWPRWPSYNKAEIEACFGRHELTETGLPTHAWESEHLRTIRTPYPLRLAWQRRTEVSRVLCHALVTESLERIFAAIWAHYGSLGQIRVARVDLFGGCYSYRRISGQARLSMHAWGAAIDLDPAHNPRGKAWRPDSGMMPGPVVDIFRGEGWRWGGDFARPDCMHFEAISE